MRDYTYQQRCVGVPPSSPTDSSKSPLTLSRGLHERLAHADPRENQADNVRVSNPFDLVVLGDRLFVADASWNTIRSVNLTSRAVSTLTTFAPLPNTRGMGPPVVEAVPDSIRVHDNQLLVTLLTGFAFPIGAAKVISVDPTTGVQTPLITGLTSAIDVLPLRGGGFLTLEFSADMLAAPTAPPSGRLQWFATANATPVVVADSLTSPTGMEIDERSGSVFITEIFTGRVLKVSPWSIASTLNPGQPSQFSNLSVRGRAGIGNDTLIAGFVIESTAKQVLIRGVGPQLTEFDVAGALADPKISVYDSNGRLVAENDNWSSGSTSETAQIVATAAKAGAFPLIAGSKDAALLRTLPPGAYTVHVSAVGGTSGVALAEVYKAQ